MASNLLASAALVSSIPGAPLSTIGTGVQRTILVADGSDVDGLSYSFDTTWRVIPVGAVTYPAAIHIRSREIVGSGTTLLLSLDNAGTNVIPITIPPGHDFLCTNATAAIYAKVAAGTCSCYVGSCETTPP